MGVYHYLYYRIYRLLEHSSFPWWSDFKAGFLMASVEGLLIAIIEFKVHLLYGIGDATELGKWGYILVIGGPPLLLNYYLFGFRDRWKEIVRYFDKADRIEKKRLSLKMTMLLLLVTGLFALFLTL